MFMLLDSWLLMDLEFKSSGMLILSTRLRLDFIRFREKNEIHWRYIYFIKTIYTFFIIRSELSQSILSKRNKKVILKINKK